MHIFTTFLYFLKSDKNPIPTHAHNFIKGCVITTNTPVFLPIQPWAMTRTTSPSSSTRKQWRSTRTCGWGTTVSRPSPSTRSPRPGSRSWGTSTSTSCRPGSSWTRAGQRLEWNSGWCTRIWNYDWVPYICRIASENEKKVCLGLCNTFF